MKFPAKFISDVIIHVVMVAIFLAIFFFSYAAFIEKGLVERETSELVGNVLDEVRIWMPPNARATVNKTLEGLKFPNLSGVDQEVEANNSVIIKRALIALSILTAAAVAILLFMHFAPVEHISWGELLVHNGILLAATGFVEFIFLTGFAQWYKPADISDFKVTMLTTLRDWANKQK